METDDMGNIVTVFQINRKDSIQYAEDISDWLEQLTSSRC